MNNRAKWLSKIAFYAILAFPNGYALHPPVIQEHTPPRVLSDHGGANDGDEKLRKGLRDLVWSLGRDIRPCPDHGSRGEQAETLLRLFLNALEVLQDRRGQADCQYQLGNAAFRRRDYTSAEVCYERGLELMRHEGDQSGIARCCHQLGLVAQAYGEHDKALQWYCRAIEAATLLKDIAAVSQSTHQLGNIFCLQGGYSNAITCYGVCLELAEARGDPAGVARAYYQLAVVAEARGDTARADRLYEAGRAIADSPGAGTKAIQCLCDLGRLAVDVGNQATALTCFKSALALADSARLDEEAAGAASAIGALYTELGEPERGLAYTLKSSAVRLINGESPGSDDASSLRRQRGALGPGRFRRLVTARLHSDQAAAILALVADGSAVAAKSI